MPIVAAGKETPVNVHDAQILIPAAIALALVGALALLSWFRRERRIAALEAASRQRDAESRAIARRRQRERDSALEDWLAQDSSPPSTLSGAADEPPRTLPPLRQPAARGRHLH